MLTATFSRFITIAKEHSHLIIDLCAEQDVIARSRLLYYLDRNHVPSEEKDRLIEQLCQTGILFEGTENEYTMNPVVVDLVNYYERRGRLTSATFLREQILGIASLTDELQRHLAAEEPQKHVILDTLDDLYRLVRQVRESGYSHYIACMRMLGDMKRSSKDKTIAQRIDELETVRRRHIEPLGELIDPHADFAHKIEALKREHHADAIRLV